MKRSAKVGNIDSKCFELIRILDKFIHSVDKLDGYKITSSFYFVKFSGFSIKKKLPPIKIEGNFGEY